MVGRKGERLIDHPHVCKDDSMGLREDSSLALPDFEH